MEQHVFLPLHVHSPRNKQDVKMQLLKQMSRHHHLSSSAHEYGGGIKSWAVCNILTTNHKVSKVFSYKFVLKEVPKPPSIRIFGFLLQESQNNSLNLAGQPS